MPSNVENMFSVRQVPWHGLGTIVQDAPTSKEAIKLAGLDWKVTQEPVYTKVDAGRFGVHDIVIPGFKANMRDTDKTVLGMVTDRYRVVQNEDAFAFTDALLGEGVKYETAGSLASGKRVWLLAKMEGKKITDEDFAPYLVFTNSHDGTGAIRAALTNVRVVCQNTLSLALKQSERQWSCVHKGDVKNKLLEAQRTLFNADFYLKNLEAEYGALKLQTLTDDKVMDFINLLIPIDDTVDQTQRKIINLQEARDEIMYRYLEAPDLKDIEKSAYRFVNAVSDYATHSEPKRHTATLQEKRFMSVVDGNALIDKAYQIVKEAV